MATWKKVIVSGSSANLATLQVDNLTASQVVIGGGTGNLSTTAINGTGTIVATTGATGLVHSGSFSGSFNGNHTGTFTGTVSTASFVTSSNVYGPYGSNSIVSSSFAVSAGSTQGTLTLGNGLTGTSFNGSANVTTAVGAGALITVGTGLVSVSTSSLSANQIPKYSSNAFAGSNIIDTGTQVQISASATSGLSVAAGGITVSAGGINVTGTATFNNTVNITGDLSVAGTASFTNTDNLNVKDKFILINSGSTTLADSGWVSQYNAAGSGSAFYLEAGSTGNYGRFAVAYDILGNYTSITADEYVVTAKINQAAGPASTVSSSWGGANSTGNMWITSGGDIYIYS